MFRNISVERIIERLNQPDEFKTEQQESQIKSTGFSNKRIIQSSGRNRNIDPGTLRDYFSSPDLINGKV